MEKPDAILATAKKFTNLLDGKVLPNVGVMTIIHHYESLLRNVPTPVVKTMSGIESNFQEEEFDEMLNEADFWDDDCPNNFSY